LLGIVHCCINRFHFIMPILSTAMETMETQPRMTMVFGVDVHPPCVMRHVRHVWTCVHHHAHTSRVGGVSYEFPQQRSIPSLVHSFNQSIIHSHHICYVVWLVGREGFGRGAGGGAGLVPLYLLGRPA
jgi:hypothetical protein